MKMKLIMIYYYKHMSLKNSKLSIPGASRSLDAGGGGGKGLPAIREAG